MIANDTDEASSGNGRVRFRLLDNTNKFYIDPTSGLLTTLTRIGRTCTRSKGGGNYDVFLILFMIYV